MKKRLLSIFITFALMFSLCISVSASQPLNQATSVDGVRMAVEHESNLQYTALLDSFADDTGKITYPDYYGGAYLNEDGNLVINVTELSDDVIAEVKADTGNENIILQAVDYSYKYLLGLQDKVVDYINNGTDRNLANKISTVVVFDDTNDITIGLTELNSNIISTLIRDIFPSNGSKTATATSMPLSFVTEGKMGIYEPIPAMKREIAPNAAVTLYAGDQISSDSGNLFSVGFPCRDKLSDGTYVYGFVTAAHGCAVGDKIHVGSTEIGEVTKRQYSGNTDAAFVKINSNSTRPETVACYFDSTGTTSYYSVPIGPIVEEAVGSTIYKDGYKTNCTSGTVKSVSASFIDSTSKITISDVIQTTYMCDSGDSGGLGFDLYSGKAYKFGIVEGMTTILGIGLRSYFVKCGNVYKGLALQTY